jgi:PIN domain nuclease of toxin-antitoxin system
MLLLDTCTLLWLASAQSRLPSSAIELIRQHAGFLFVSSITAFEIGLAERKRRLSLPMPAERYYAIALKTHGVHEIAIDGVIAARSTALPALHADPADRMIVATAQLQDLAVLTPDSLIAAYPATRVVW